MRISTGRIPLSPLWISPPCTETGGQKRESMTPSSSATEQCVSMQGKVFKGHCNMRSTIPFTTGDTQAYFRSWVRLLQLDVRLR